MRVRDASVAFQMDRGESRVLNDVDVDIRREEVLGVIGESGSGKSMFASSLLNAVVEPGVTTGEITYYPSGGEPVDVLGLDDDELRAFRWEEVAMVFQGAMSSFNPVMTIGAHFRETVDQHDYDMTEGMERARQLISDLYMDPDRVLDSYPHELSGGMQQRALIALSLVLEPEVLVMDEPTAALDLLMQRSILSLLADLKATYDLTIVFITHDLPLVTGLADRLGVMYAFELAEMGPTDRVLTEPSHPYTRALLNSVPNLDSPLSEMGGIEGSSPDPVNIPTGCSYHPRCPLADESCEQEHPPFEGVGAGHRAACYYPKRAREEIPLTTRSTADVEERYEGSQSADPVVSMDDVEVHFEPEEGLLASLGLSTGDPEPPVRAVDGVDLDVYENDVVALVGESGCGKTTLGKTAIGVQRPTAGTVSYRDQDVWAARDGADDVDVPFEEIRTSLQVIHQDPGSSLNPNRTVQAIIGEALKNNRPDLNANDRRYRINELLEVVGMTPSEDYAQRYPHQLSGGEKQRVALIRALLMNPDLILADEAVSALDVSLRVDMMDLMLDLQDEFNTSYLFISHDLSNARYFAGKADGRIGVMYLGEIVEVGPAEAVIEDPKHPYTKVLKWSTADLDIDEEATDPPVRGIDIPDPKNPPSGCRFHPRCPEAREVCREQHPVIAATADDEHRAGCFRDFGPDHEYWDSDPLPEMAAESDPDGPDSSRSGIGTD